MWTPFSKYQSIEDIIPDLQDDNTLVIPLCDNIVEIMGKMLDPFEDECFAFDRDDAVIPGLFAKIQKMAADSLSAYVNNNINGSFIFYRIEYEAYIKMRYLIKHGKSACEAYRLSSYKARFKVFEQYHDKPTPVYKTMEKKFKCDIEEDGFSLNDISSNKEQAFGGRNFRQLMDEFDEGDYYDLVYGVMSDFIHSDWGEIRQQYLFGDGEKMAVRFQPVEKHYRSLIPYARLNIQAADAYFEWCRKHNDDIVSSFVPLMEEFRRVLFLIDTHIKNIYTLSPETFFYH